MFAIERYDVEKEEKSTASRDIILKSLKADAAKRKGLSRKRKLSDCNITEPKVDAIKDDDMKVDPLVPKSKTPKKGADYPPLPTTADTSHVTDKLDKDSCTPEDVKNLPTVEHGVYDPLSMFRKQLKSSNKLLSTDLARSIRDGLPEWIKYPKYIDNINSAGDSLATNSILSTIDSAIMENLKSLKVTRLFPVQTDVIPTVLNSFIGGKMTRPNDICVCSPTGSGKTLVFAISIVQYMLQYKPHGTAALIIIPTIELAKQVHEIFLSVSKGLDIFCALLGNGQVDSDMQLLGKKSKYNITRFPEIIVSTPGRFAHLLEIPGLLNMEELRFLVIDEADRILDLLKQSWLNKLKNKVPHWNSSSRIALRELCKPGRHVQKLLFSATLNPDPEKLKDLDLFQPRLFVPKPVASSRRPSQYVLPPTLSQYSVACKANDKPFTVVSLLANLNVQKALCFTGTAESARRLHLVMNYYVSKNMLAMPCIEFSSLLSKKSRKQNMAQFTTSKSCCLVSSDVAARGIDATDIEVVIIYDIPQYIEAYVHRAGRASRAGKKGSAYSLVTEDDMQSFKKLFQKAKLSIPDTHDNKWNDKIYGEYENALSYCQKMSSKSKEQ